jgi:malate dehydrogenase (oxaloacetate-decarboxylating)(NADP+)
MNIIARAKNDPARVIFTEGDHYKVIKAAETLINEAIATPVLLGNKKKIKATCEEYKIQIDSAEIIDLFDAEVKEKIDRYADELYKLRQRKGMTQGECKKLMKNRNYFGNMMLKMGEGDALVTGLTKEYAKCLPPALQIIGVMDGVRKVSGMYIISRKNQTFFFADTTVQENPTAEEMVEIMELTADAVRIFHEEPRMAVLSYSNFGSAKGAVPEKARKVVELARKKMPNLIIDGDIQANVALDKGLMRETYPFSTLAETGANTLIFPDLASGNIAYKLVMELGGADAIGPILMGMKQPVHILQLGSSIRQIVNIASIAVLHAHILKKSGK